MSSSCLNSPINLTDLLMSFSNKFPPETDIFSYFMAFSISEKDKFLASNSNGLTIIDISFSSTPAISTLDTSEIFSNSSFNISPYDSSFSIEYSPDNVTLITGKSEKLISYTSDSLGRSVGKLILALSTASFILDFAYSISVPETNSATIVEKP